MRRIIVSSLLILAVAVSSCEDIIEVPDIADQNVHILAPVEGSTITSNSVHFNWDILLDAENYRVQLANPNFENASQIVVDSLFAKDTLGFISHQLQLPLLNGNYQWRIKALNSGYETAFTSSRFKVDGDANADIIPPNTPVLLSPENNSAQDETDIHFTWSRDDSTGSAERDSIYIFTDENQQTLEIKALGANKTFDANLTTNTYYWVVKAFDTAGNESVTSTAFQLTIN